MVSVVSLYELLFKASLGKLATPGPTLQAFLDSCTLRRLAVTETHAEIAAKIKWTHRDPWDRILAAQVITERACLISKDTVFDQIGIPRIWEDPVAKSVSSGAGLSPRVHVLGAVPRM